MRSSTGNRCESVSRETGCEFCLEFSESDASRFALAYGGTTGSRIIAKQEGVVVLPTLGQLFAGSLLILPLAHFETAADMPKEQLGACLRLVSVFMERLRPFGRPVIFEHGARADSGRSCGIYHAHLHLVPVPSDMSIEDAMPSDGKEAPTIESAYDALKGEDNYLLFRDTCGGVRYVAGAAARSERYGSQYFRKRLAGHFHLSSQWDWREYNGVELPLLETVRALRCHVAVS